MIGGVKAIALRTRILISLLILTSLFGYLEWGGGNASFLYEAELEILIKLFSTSESVMHPFTIIPLVGQILLLISIFQKKPKRMIIYLGISCLGFLLGFMFIIGILSWKLKIVLSTLPFIIISTIILIKFKK